MEREIALESHIPHTELKRRLENRPTWTSNDLALRVDGADSGYRGVDSGVLIAVIGVGGYALKELLQGMFAIAKETRAHDIEMQWEDKRLKLPASTPPEEIDRLIAHLNSASLRKVRIE